MSPKFIPVIICVKTVGVPSYLSQQCCEIRTPVTSFVVDKEIEAQRSELIGEDH